MPEAKLGPGLVREDIPLIQGSRVQCAHRDTLCEVFQCEGETPGVGSGPSFSWNCGGGRPEEGCSR